MKYYSSERRVVTEGLIVGTTTKGIVADKELMTIKEDDAFLEFPLKKCRIVDPENGNVLYFVKLEDNILKSLKEKEVDIVMLAFEHPDCYRLIVADLPEYCVKTDEKTEVTEKGKVTSFVVINDNLNWVIKIKDKTNTEIDTIHINPSKSIIFRNFDEEKQKRIIKDIQEFNKKVYDSLDIKRVKRYRF